MTSTPFYKCYKSPLQLISILKERGLIIIDERRVEKELQDIGYYRFTAYLYPLIAIPKMAHRFKGKSDFESALALYNFDKDLRFFLFQRIAEIEIAVRSAIANIVTSECGDVFWMTEERMFADKEAFEKSKSIIDKEVNKSEEDFVKHFHAKYTDPYPPAWMLTELLSIGTLNRIYKNLANGVLRKKVAIHFSLNVPVFTSWLTTIALTRNACAHHSRVWNKENAIIPAFPKNLDRPWVSPNISHSRIFYNICIIKYFLDIIRPENSMKQDFLTLIQKYPSVDISAMGIPEKWQEEELWRDR